MAMHLHASASEGEGSVRSQLAQAATHGYDVAWFTEHDWRRRRLLFRPTYSFVPGELVNGGAWELERRPDEGALAGGSGGSQVDDPVSPADPAARKASLRIRATSAGDDPAAVGFKIQAKGGSRTNFQQPDRRPGREARRPRRHRRTGRLGRGAALAVPPPRHRRPPGRGLRRPLPAPHRRARPGDDQRGPDRHRRRPGAGRPLARGDPRPGHRPRRDLSRHGQPRPLAARDRVPRGQPAVRGGRRVLRPPAVRGAGRLRRPRRRERPRRPLRPRGARRARADRQRDLARPARQPVRRRADALRLRAGPQPRRQARRRGLSLDRRPHPRGRRAGLHQPPRGAGRPRCSRRTPPPT